jgi:hypothetical protein
VADLLVIVPARTRSWNISRLLTAWGDTRAWGVADLRIEVDADDPHLPDYYALTLPDGAHMVTWDVWQPCMHKLESAVAQEVDDYFAIGFMGDDHVPRTDGWAQRWLEALRELGSGTVYGRDGYQDEELPTQWATTTDIIKALGRMVPAPVEHLFSDTAVGKLGREAGCLRYLPDTFIEHMHYIVGKAPHDAQYEKVNSTAQWQRDEAAYYRWEAEQLPADVETIRALR